MATERYASFTLFAAFLATAALAVPLDLASLVLKPDSSSPHSPHPLPLLQDPHKALKTEPHPIFSLINPGSSGSSGSTSGSSGTSDQEDFENLKTAIGTACRFQEKSLSESQCRAGGCSFIKGNCLCRRSQDDCEKLDEQCTFDKKEDFCVSRAESLYTTLAALLKKRGKKDFAIRLEYQSRPGRSFLPYGPKGPSIFGYGKNFLQGVGYQSPDPYSVGHFGGHQLDPYGHHAFGPSYGQSYGQYNYGGSYGSQNAYPQQGNYGYSYGGGSYGGGNSYANVDNGYSSGSGYSSGNNGYSSGSGSYSGYDSNTENSYDNNGGSSYEAPDNSYNSGNTYESGNSYGGSSSYSGSGNAYSAPPSYGCAYGGQSHGYQSYNNDGYGSYMGGHHYGSGYSSPFTPYGGYPVQTPYFAASGYAATSYPSPYAANPYSG